MNQYLVSGLFYLQNRRTKWKRQAMFGFDQMLPFCGDAATYLARLASSSQPPPSVTSSATSAASVSPAWHQYWSSSPFSSYLSTLSSLQQEQHFYATQPRFSPASSSGLLFPMAAYPPPSAHGIGN